MSNSFLRAAAAQRSAHIQQQQLEVLIAKVRADKKSSDRAIFQSWIAIAISTAALIMAAFDMIMRISR